jgi:hypothetical protein
MIFRVTFNLGDIVFYQKTHRSDAQESALVEAMAAVRKIFPAKAVSLSRVIIEPLQGPDDERAARQRSTRRPAAGSQSGLTRG